MRSSQNLISIEHRTSSAGCAGEDRNPSVSAKTFHRRDGMRRPVSSRDALSSMRTILDDLRFGFRLLLSRPGFTLIAVFTLALGISVTTAMFSVLDTLYWKAFPGAANPGRLVELETVAPDGSMVRGSWLDFREYREHLRPVAAVAAHDETSFNLGLNEQARPVWGELVSGNYFEVLGVKAALGRVLSAEEYTDTPGAHPVAVISHRLWTNEFQADRGVLGKTVRVNRHNLTIIGVTPPEFRGAMAGIECDLWVPFTMGRELGAVEQETFRDASLRNVYMFARLAPGTRIGEARAELPAIAQRIAASDPNGHRGFSATFEPMWRAQLHGRAAFLQPMLILMAVSLLVLAIVCANVANLLLARSVGRLREFAVRVALGASRWRLARQSFTETLLLAAAGALVGVPLALWMTDSASSLSDGPYTGAFPEGFVPRHPEDVKVHRTSVAPGYFRLLKIPLLEGRDFTENDDRQTQLVMMVDQAFARRFYGGASPVGRRVMVWKQWFTVVGLVRDSKYFSFTEAPRPHFYLPFRQSYQLGQHIVFFVRTKADPEAAISTVRTEAAAVDPNASSFTAAPLAEYNALLLFPLKLAASLLAVLGAIAFLLAGVDLYGVMSYAVGQRTQEMGIRMALGARPREVLGIVVRQGMLLTAGGVAIGVALSLASMRLLAAFLVGVSPFDALTFAAASLFLAAVAAVASFLPARRATRIDPFTALRSE